VAATSVGSVDAGAAAGALLSVDGVRRLRRLLVTGAGGQASGT
jgi:hypothetical protein